ncbi:metal ABC transporter ATP-binding protein [Kushneria indalinina]|uniref:ABC-type Mn2+/Zn2+ transport system ATPase subunit n=1 Tax=Kushneria indalinina DSM 14324 TaxID=1122140 RepID=A0A3D9DTV9_9GAMM|nr:metal ABC transporter ATP-binding protein [Kushneria indalinina]REC94208.1 ABC-type Mn2+/Zn2+ transport system ATPase subunit [Kushneria indalinina DSM 14324]
MSNSHQYDDPVVDVSRTSVRYPDGHLGIRDISLTLPAGSVCALIGPNGSGKSTLCKTILGFTRPTSGRVRLMGMTVRQAQKRNLVAYVPQAEDVDWQFPVSVWDVVMMGRQGQMNWLRIPSATDRRCVEEAMARMEITDLARRQIGMLSGGQKKRVFLARALAQGSRVLVLDEPFTGVDAHTEQGIMGLIRGLRDEGVTVLIVTHALSNVPQYCDHVAMVSQQLVAFGPVATTFTQRHLAATFGDVMADTVLSGAETATPERASAWSLS